MTQACKSLSAKLPGMGFAPLPFMQAIKAVGSPLLGASRPKPKAVSTVPIEVSDRATAKRHRCLRAKPHPNGKPFGYCSRCSFVVVRFLDMWWHLQAEAADMPKRPSGKKAGGDD